MKKLICARDVEALPKQGEKVIYIDKDTLLTPSAKDAAKACGITFSTEAPPICVTPALVAISEVPDSATEVPDSATEVPKASDSIIDTNMIYTVLKELADKGLLNGVFDAPIN